MKIGCSTMKTPSPIELSRLRDDIQRAYDALIRERFGLLTPRQRQRLDEITVPMQKVSSAVDEYEKWRSMSNSLRIGDARYRLMYAARTPMEMVLQCAYFLHINHMRKNELLNQDQIEAVWLMERSGRRLVLEIERLWAEMRAEQSTAGA
ncbi:MAG: hypothetical protein ABI970_16470 [Chloroflexota bacterium]